ncbi:MAG: VOC family protein [Pikeienuella sp.]
MSSHANVAVLEHANITVTDTQVTAAWMKAVFGWHVRWEGASIHDGYSLHIGGENSYLALYSPPSAVSDPGNTYTTRGGLNHLAVVVDDIDAAEVRVKAAGFETNSHADYEPGRRFYFYDADGIEYEIVSY